MALNMKGRNLATLHDLALEEMQEIFKASADLKRKHKAGEATPVLKGKTLAMIFQKPSTRTRVSFEVGIYQLGGTGLYLGPNDLQLNRGETIEDTARVLSRFVDGIMARVFSHNDILTLCKHASVPVINGLSDLTHPCQVLADLLTITERRGELKGLKMAYIGDGNNMAHSLMLGCAKVGMHISVAAPHGYQPKAEIVEWAREDASATGARVEVTTDPVAAAKNADIIYTDVWASMGQESEHSERVNLFQPYQINAGLTAHAKKDYLFMHCLPAHRGEEVSAEVIDGPHSIVFDQAENRLHAQKGLMALLMQNET
ncbi:MAG: ornithine carbamoyltransferase [Planctomycetota bacterium]|nr:MAG: ornithine carbamoyltransferase [Planctomycetota bacterium]